MRKRQKQVAYHEAGHAVARIHVGAEPTAIEIEGTEGLCEGTGKPWVSAHHGQYSVWNHLIVLLAGVDAEARVSKRCRVDLFLGAGAYDYQVARPAIDWLVANNYADSSDAAWRRA